MSTYNTEQQRVVITKKLAEKLQVTNISQAHKMVNTVHRNAQ
jgi:hypothetical protein